MMLCYEVVGFVFLFHLVFCKCWC